MRIPQNASQPAQDLVLGSEYGGLESRDSRGYIHNMGPLSPATGITSDRALNFNMSSPNIGKRLSHARPQTSDNFSILKSSALLGVSQVNLAATTVRQNKM